MSAVIVKALWIYGLAAVVSMLIAAVIKAIVVLLNLFEHRRPGAAAVAPHPCAAPAPMAADIAADHIAAIGAAVYVAIGAHRIVRIDDSRGATGWSVEGRLAHHASHEMPAPSQKR